MDNKWISNFTKTNSASNNNKTWEKYKNFQNWNYNKKSNQKNNIINRYSAGILPYTYDLNGNCLVLLGKDQDGVWSDFGGRCEIKDNYDQIQTASREFYEETLGSIISIEECIEKINSNEKKIISKTLNGSPYYMYLIYIDYYNYVDTFLKTYSFMKYHFNNEKHQINKIIEKNNIKWFSINVLINSINNNNEIKKIYPLRNVFLKTLEKSKDELIYFIT